MSTPGSNVSSAGDAATLTPPASATAGRSMGQTLIVLIRRELWEHRSLWLAPLVISGLLIVSAFLMHFGSVMFDDDEVWAHHPSRGALLGLGQWGLSVPEFMVMLIVLSFYLLDCLYAERKDRSILFWKSMPVSDGVTVASKLITALVVVPLGVYVLTLITSLLFWAVIAVRGSIGGLPPLGMVWDTVAWLKVEALMIFGVFVSMFWYAPAAAYLILISAWARRNVLLWATLPPVVAVILERFTFGTHYVTDFIEYRTVGIWDAFNPDYHAAQRTVTDGQHHIISLPGMFDTLDVTQPFLNVDLWLGVAVAAGLAFAAVRIRRYRDDT